MSDAADIRTLMSAAGTAAEAGDYATALGKLEHARALLAATPDMKTATAEYHYRPEDLDALEARWRQARSGANGISRSKVTYTRATP